MNSAHLFVFSPFHACLLLLANSASITKDSKPVSIATESKRGNYKCGRCGQYKVNHVCKYSMDDALREFGVNTLEWQGIGEVGEKVIKVGVWGGGGN